MGSLDVTIVNISLPTISRYFDVGTGMVSWIVLAYLLVDEQLSIGLREDRGPEGLQEGISGRVRRLRDGLLSARVQMADLPDGAVQGTASLIPLTLGFHDAFLVGAGFSVLAVILSAVARDAS